jgi:predicted DCC family thiol-disulfide oxidoreductase YuxK
MKGKPIIFFDGVCNLCNGAIQLIIKYDKLSIFKFASLQSDFAEQILSPYGLDVSKLDSIVLLQNGKVYNKSSAVLHIVRQLR